MTSVLTDEAPLVTLDDLPPGYRPLPYDVHFAARVIQDAMAHASAAQWARRAEQLEDARPRRTDFHGQATPAELSARWQRLTAMAAACRARAQVGDISDPELTDLCVMHHEHNRTVGAAT